MEFDEILRKRSMIRSYKQIPVEEEKIRKILRNAIRAPSAGHLQPWEFIVVKDEEVKRQLGDAASGQDWISTAPVIIITCANIERASSKYGGRGEQFYSIIDASFACLLILLTVVEEGLGACFVASFNDNDVSKILKLPKHVRPIAIIPVGYPATGPRKLQHMPLEALVHEESW